MKIVDALIELMVTNVDVSVSFYSQVLGFELMAEEYDEGKRYWALVASKSGFKISFKEKNRLKHEVSYLRNLSVGGSAMICFQVDDLTGYYDKVHEQCRLLDHPHLTPCGVRSFSMLDNSGYIITVEKSDK